MNIRNRPPMDSMVTADVAKATKIQTKKKRKSRRRQKMSDEQKPVDPATPPPTPEPTPAPSTVVSIQINWDMATGETQFMGPIGNKTLCYGMLKMAEKLVDGHVSESQKKAQAGMMQKLL